MFQSIHNSLEFTSPVAKSLAFRAIKNFWQKCFRWFYNPWNVERHCYIWLTNGASYRKNTSILTNMLNHLPWLVSVEWFTSFQNPSCWGLYKPFFWDTTGLVHSLFDLTSIWMYIKVFVTMHVSLKPFLYHQLTNYLSSRPQTCITYGIYI